MSNRDPVQRKRLFGVGPGVVGPAIVWLAASWAIGAFTPSMADGVPTHACQWVGGVLLGVGVVLYVIGVVQFGAAVRGELVTSGLFSWCRHPFYGLWIFLLLPGMACIVGNWMAFGAPFVAVMLFFSLIRREEVELETRFGQAYRDYASRVGRLWP